MSQQRGAENSGEGAWHLRDAVIGRRNPRDLKGVDARPGWVGRQARLAISAPLGVSQPAVHGAGRLLSADAPCAIGDFG